METKSSLYDILQVQSGCSEEAVKTAFRKLAQIHHPDKNGNSPESAMRFHLILNAYRILSVPETRKEYDAYLRTSRVMKPGPSGKKRGTEAPPAGGPEFLLSQLNFLLWEVEDIWTAACRKEAPGLLSGRPLEEWLMELLFFMDKWILEPGGFPDYFFQARRIDRWRPSERFGTLRDTGNHRPYVRFDDYFYNLRIRANQFLARTGGKELWKELRVLPEGRVIALERPAPEKGGSAGVSGEAGAAAASGAPRLADAMTESFRMAYHHLGALNRLLKGEEAEMTRFVHSRSCFEEGAPGVLEAPDRSGGNLLPRPGA